MEAPDYFAFLGLAPSLSLDTADLQQRFYRLSRELHPDKFSRALPAERERSVEAAAILNDAYRTLRDPVERAEYFLRLAGVTGAAGNGPPPGLLAEVFELNELLEDTSAGPQLAAAREQFEHRLEDADRRLEQLFRDYDHSREAALLGLIRTELDRRKYVVKLLGRLAGP